MSDDDFAVQRALHVGDLTIGFREAGEHGQPVLLLLHGLGASAVTWSVLAQRYQQDYHVVALDLRGHGASSWPGSYALPEMAADVAGAIHNLGLRDVTVLAHSMGASVALLLATRFPRGLARVILEEPPPPVPASPAREEGPRPEEPLDYDWDIQAQFSWQRNNPDPQWLADLKAVALPVTIVRGAHSHISRDAVRELAAALPASRVLELDGGHDLHVGDPGFIPLLDNLLGVTPAP